MREKKKILYIAGSGRSGSTLLARILGETAGFVNVGEVQRIWKRGIIEDGICGCGKHVLECEEWKSIFEYGFGGLQFLSPARMAYLESRLLRTRYFPIVLTGLRNFFRPAEQREYGQGLSRLYKGIFDKFGDKIVVDSSKYPSYFAFLSDLGEHDIYIVHLVRDPRAVAYSWKRKKFNPEKKDKLFGRIGAIRSSVVWFLWNATMEFVKIGRKKNKKYLLVKYEDLVNQTEDSIRQIINFVGTDADKNLSDRSGDDDSGAQHTIAGNPNRFNSGKVIIKKDNEWMGSMARPDRIKVNFFTFPLLIKYKYVDFWK